MDLTHRFTVPTGVEETWAHFQDIQGLAECFPGATVTSVEDSTFTGSCKVKLGPIALVYNGSGTFVEKDDTDHRFVVDAKGKDKRGNGTAGAKVKLSMQASSQTPGSTDVEVLTDLAITGKPAQFGRGVMQDVSDKLLGQFVGCLEQRLSGPSGEEVAAQSAAAAPPVDPAAASAPAGETSAPSAMGAPAAPAAPAPVSAVPRHAAPPPQDDALDLGAAVIPILAKTYWRQAAAGLGVLLVLRWLLGRR
ncbi:SRPBCC family protein [Nocardioides kribbensis]|uniref:SRPBCC family protein n=1 Tax=Nocardioides kribbensis TaxID=305517 RepID=UPI00187A8D93|nr:SRPBCC family protein [Nocardioides kribbensis]